MTAASFFSVRRQVCYLSGPIDNDHTAILYDFLLRLQEENKTSGKLVINSEGGDEVAGFAMYDLIKNFASNRVTLAAIGIGQVQSAAILPFLACDRRYATPNCAFMVHQGTFCLPEPEPQRDAAQLVKELLRLDRAYAKIIAEHTGQPLKLIKKLIGSSYYFDAKEALKLNFITEISK